MEINEAIDGIKTYAPRYARKEVYFIRTNIEAATPLLLAFLEKSVENHKKAIIDGTFDLDTLDNYYWPMYAMYLLAEFKAPAAFSLFMQIAALDDATYEYMLGDSMNNDFGRMLASTAQHGDEAKLLTLIKSPETGIKQRIAALTALGALSLKGDFPRQELATLIKTLTTEDPELTAFYATFCDNISKNPRFFQPITDTVAEMREWY